MKKSANAPEKGPSKSKAAKRPAPAARSKRAADREVRIADAMMVRGRKGGYLEVN